MAWNLNIFLASYSCKIYANHDYLMNNIQTTQIPPPRLPSPPPHLPLTTTNVKKKTLSEDPDAFIVTLSPFRLLQKHPIFNWPLFFKHSQWGTLDVLSLAMQPCITYGRSCHTSGHKTFLNPLLRETEDFPVGSKYP